MSTASTANITDMINNKMDDRSEIAVTTLIFLVLGLAISVLNISCLVVLAKEEKLRTKRFYKLTVCLSISDASTGLFSSALSFHVIHFKLTGNGLPPFCFIAVCLISTTILFSLLQTLWICLERLIATFPLVRNPCMNFSVVAMTTVLFLICAAYVFPIVAIFGNVWSEECSPNMVFGKNRITVLRYFQPLYLVTILFIIVIYLGIIFRIYKSWRRVNPIGIDNQAGASRMNKLRSKKVQTKAETCTSIPRVETEMHGQCQEINKLETSHSFSQSKPDQSRSKIGMDTSTEEQNNEKNKTSHQGFRRIRKTTVTLGLLILVMMFSVLPKVSLGVAVINNPYSVGLNYALGISDLFLFLNPLADPVIYVLRIKSFRNRLKCFKC